MEIWKTIKGFENYEVSNLGNVKSLNYNKTKNEKLLKLCVNKQGYKIVILPKKTLSVHQLVAEAFLNHIPSGYKFVVNHKNFIRSDNRVENLEIVTMRENVNQKHLKSSSQYTGVHKLKNSNKWQSHIIINKNKKHLGTFENEIDAHLAYEKALKEIII